MRLAYAYIAPPEAPARADPCPFVRRVFRTLALDLPQTFEVFAHAAGHGDAAVRFRTPPDREAAMRRQPFELDGATLTLLRGYEIVPSDPVVSQASASDETAAAAAAAAAEEDASAGEVVGPDSKDLQQQSKALDKLTDHVEDRQLDSSRVHSIYEAAAESSSARSARDARTDSKDLQQQSKALDKLTDHVEDRQLDSSRVQSIYETAADAGPDSKDLQQQSKALDKLTDHVEDRQLDSSRAQSAMAALASSKKVDRNAMRSRDKELDGVRINPTDVEIIANELELDKKIAERTLREHKGDAVAAVRFLLR